MAYAMSIHKSQGSEYKSVIVLICDEHEVMLKRNLIYTAITRATDYIKIIGNKTALHKAIKTDMNEVERRKTTLIQRIQKHFEKEIA